MKEIVRCCHVAVYVVMGVVVVASGSSPSAYIRGLIRRIDRGDPNVPVMHRSDACYSTSYVEGYDGSHHPRYAEWDILRPFIGAVAF